jgi:hypothetical protein
MISALRLSVLLFTWSLLSITIAEEGPQFSISDYNRQVQENERAECKTVTGVIEAVESGQDSATIRLRTDSTKETRKQPKSAEKRKTSEEISFHWNNADGPPPLCRGMKPTVTLNASGNVVDITFIAATTHWRKRKDGLVEVVLGYKDKQGPLRYLYVCPGKISGGTDVHWTRKWGTLITTDAAGPEAVEIEPVASSDLVLPIANAAEMKIMPGRDGWKALPNFDEALREPTPAEEKAWQAFHLAIPKNQKMTGAG